MVIIYSLLFTSVLAICPGYNWGIGSRGNDSYGHYFWKVYDVQTCEIHQIAPLLPGVDPCKSEFFNCEPGSKFNQYNDTGIFYDCYQDVNSGTCDSDHIEVCCRNDGKISASAMLSSITSVIPLSTTTSLPVPTMNSTINVAGLIVGNVKSAIGLVINNTESSIPLAINSTLSSKPPLTNSTTSLVLPVTSSTTSNLSCTLSSSSVLIPITLTLATSTRSDLLATEYI
jgi:hypothetical protein